MGNDSEILNPGEDGEDSETLLVFQSLEHFFLVLQQICTIELKQHYIIEFSRACFIDSVTALC